VNKRNIYFYKKIVTKKKMLRFISRQVTVAALGIRLCTVKSELAELHRLLKDKHERAEPLQLPMPRSTYL